MIINKNRFFGCTRKKEALRIKAPLTRSGNKGNCMRIKKRKVKKFYQKGGENKISQENYSFFTNVTKLKREKGNRRKNVSLFTQGEKN